MKSDAQLTWDENKAPYSTRFEDRYFSREDGRAETRQVFLAGNNLPDCWHGATHFQIAELGFGTGLNFLETLAAWQSEAPVQSSLSFTSFELYPLSCDEMAKALSHWSQLAPLTSALLDQWPPQSPLQFGNAQLKLIIGDARHELPRWHGQADAWYLDGFSPANNPQLWQTDLMQAVFDHTKPGGTFSTYTAAGYVRRNLQAAGFEVSRVPGFGGKRERLQGIKKHQRPSQIFLEAAKSGDIEDIKALLQETWHDTYDGVFGPQKVDQYCDHWHSIEHLKKRLAKDRSVMLVARHNKIIVGTASASIDADTKMIMKQLYVKPDHQGRGIGGQLYERLLDLLPGFSHIEIEVEPSNQAAIDFYQKRGFVITKLLEDCGDTGDLVKALMMTRVSK